MRRSRVTISPHRHDAPPSAPDGRRRCLPRGEEDHPDKLTALYHARLGTSFTRRVTLPAPHVLQVHLLVTVS
jgi:hypothetical protein